MSLILKIGESVLYVTGEVHLQRCITDLETLFNLHNLQISTPIVPFRETLGVESCIGKNKLTQLLPEIFFDNLPPFLLDEFDFCTFNTINNGEFYCPSRH